MTKSNYQRILEDKPIAYHPDLARISGSVTAGIFLSQLIYWSSRGIRKDGYIWKIQSEWEEETALSRYEQETARKKLKAKGILLEKKVGVPAKLHYKINWKILNALLDAHYTQTSMRESNILESDNPANKDGGIPQAITESTAESTQETTTDDDVVDVDADFGEVSASYLDNIGTVSKIIGDNLQDAYDEYGKGWVLDAIREAAERNVLKWKYIDTILTNWKNEGRQKKDEPPTPEREIPQGGLQWVDGSLVFVPGQIDVIASGGING